MRSSRITHLRGRLEEPNDRKLAGLEAVKKVKDDEEELDEDSDPDEEVRDVDGSSSRAVRRTLLEAERDDDRRHVDLAVSLRLCDVEQDEHGRARWRVEADEEVIEVGGRWDRREKRWSGGARRVRVIGVHRGQEEAVRWIAESSSRAAIGPKGKHWEAPMKHAPWWWPSSMGTRRTARYALPAHVARVAATNRVCEARRGAVRVCAMFSSS